VITYARFLMPPNIVLLVCYNENIVLLQSRGFDGNQRIVEKDLGSVELVVVRNSLCLCFVVFFAENIGELCTRSSYIDNLVGDACNTAITTSTSRRTRSYETLEESRQDDKE